MRLHEFRKGTPLQSTYITRKWVHDTPQRSDAVRLGGEFYIVNARYFGTGDHIVIFVSCPVVRIPNDTLWIYPITNPPLRIREEREEEE